MGCNKRTHSRKSSSRTPAQQCDFGYASEDTLECGRCGRRVKISHPLQRVFAMCKVQPDTMPGDTVSEAEIKQRREQCSNCDAYMGGDRCTLIDMGCSTTYLAALHAKPNGCPRKLWADYYVPRDVRIKERVIVCRKCQWYLGDNECRLAGNLTPLLAKRTARCPIGKWVVQWQDATEDQAVIDAIPNKRPRLIITVGTGRHCAQLLRVTGKAFRKYAERCDADYVELTNDTQMWWGLEKFRVHRFCQHWDRVLFLDADVCIGDYSPNLFEEFPEGRVAMHDDWPHLPATAWSHVERSMIMQSQGQRRYTSMEQVLNSGVVMSDLTCPNVWMPPQHPFEATHCAEQMWVEHNAMQYPLHFIPVDLNTQYWMPRFHKLWPEARIVHLANCPEQQRVRLATYFCNGHTPKS